MTEAVTAVIKAWTVPGRAPRIHEAEKERLKRAWPTLAYALENLALDGKVREIVRDEMRGFK